MSTPKIIHQIWFQSRNVPPKYSAYRNAVQSIHPDYMYMLWTETDIKKLIILRYPYHLQNWQSYKRRIQKIDAGKYYILHSIGGVYIDMDMEPVEPLDDLLGNDLVVSRFDAPVMNSLGVIIGMKLYCNNGVIACPPNHPVMSAVIEDLTRSSTDSHLGLAVTICKTTGPGFFSKHVLKGINEGHKIRTLPRRILEAKSKKDRVRGTKMFHHSQATWLPSSAGVVLSKTNRMSANERRAFFMITTAFVLFSALYMGKGIIKRCTR